MYVKSIHCVTKLIFFIINHLDISAFFLALYSDGFSKAYDIVFMFDGAMGEIQKDLTIMFVKMFKNEVKFGVIVSQNISYVPFTLADNYSNKEYINAINSIELRAEKGDLVLSMQEARVKLFTNRIGTRSGVPKILIIYTNGILAKDERVENETFKLKKADVSIIVIGYGQNIDYSKMRLLGGDNVVLLQDTDEKSKENFLENLSQRVMYGRFKNLFS